MWSARIITVDTCGPHAYISNHQTRTTPEMKMTFTAQNTEGYTAEQIAALNAELAERLSQIDPDDAEAMYAAEKAFSDEIAQR